MMISLMCTDTISSLFFFVSRFFGIQPSNVFFFFYFFAFGVLKQSEHRTDIFFLLLSYLWVTLSYQKQRVQPLSYTTCYPVLSILPLPPSVDFGDFRSSCAVKLSLCDLFSRNTSSSLALTHISSEASRMLLIVLRFPFCRAPRWALGEGSTLSIQQPFTACCVLTSRMLRRETICTATNIFSSSLCIVVFNRCIFSTLSLPSVSCLLESLNLLRLHGFPPLPRWARRGQTSTSLIRLGAALSVILPPLRLLLAAGWGSARLYTSSNSLSTEIIHSPELQNATSHMAIIPKLVQWDTPIKPTSSSWTWFRALRAPSSPFFHSR